MRILINAPELSHWGGVASYHRALKPYLDGQADYFAVGARPGEEGFARRAVRLVGDYLGFVRRLRGRRYDLVFLNPSLCREAVVRDGLFLLLAKLAGKRVLVFIHGWDPDYERTLRGGRLRLFRSLYGRADACVVLAAEFRDRLRALGVSAPIFVETTVVGDADFPDALPLRRRDPQEPFHVLYLSRVEKAKGIYETLDAFAAVRRARPTVALTVAGDGSELAPAQAYVARRGIPDVTFAGYLRGKQKQEAFARAHCFLFPTHAEGMPISVLEAMAHGLPVITRPVGGLKDFFEHEKMGFLTESMAPETFAGFLERLIADPRLGGAIGRYNRSFARERFAASRVAQRLRGILGSLNVVESGMRTKKAA